MNMIRQPTKGPAFVSLDSFGTALNVVVVGASGGIGGAFADHLAGSDRVARVTALSREDPGLDEAKCAWLPIDIENEESIEAAAAEIRASGAPVHMVIVTTGILHDGDDLTPEKTWRTLSSESLKKAFCINTIGPGLVAKHFLPLLARRRKTAFAVLSARVGSISDNRLGGWYAYRASKAAVNMLVRTLAIELKRSNPDALCVALHPGTVDSRLSKPFQSNVPDGKLFSPEKSAGHLLSVIDGLSPEQSGKLFAWDGTEVPF